MAISRKKKRTAKLSAQAKKALTYTVDNGGTQADALRAAGYSQAIIRNPKRVFESSAFAKALEDAGVTDIKVAKRYSRLLNSSRIETLMLDGWRDGRKWAYPKDSEVRKMIEGDEHHPTGCDVLYIRIDTTYHRLVVTYRHPDNAAQTRIIELVGKVKSHFAPEKLGVVEHTMSEADRQLLEGLNGK